MTKNVEIAGTTYQMTVNAEGVSIHRLENGTWVGCCSESSIDNCAAVFGDEDTTEAVYDELQDLVDEFDHLLETGTYAAIAEEATAEFEAVLEASDPGYCDVSATVQVIGNRAVAWAEGAEDGPYWTGLVDELPLVEYPVTSDLFGVPAAEVEERLDAFVEAIQEAIPGLRFTALHNVGGAIRRSPEASDFLETAANVAVWERASELAFGELAEANF